MGTLPSQQIFEKRPQPCWQSNLWQRRGGGDYKMLKFLLQLKIQGHHLIGKLQTVESGVAGWAKQGRNTELWGIPLVGGGGVREMASRPRHNQARRLLSDSFKIQS